MAAAATARASSGLQWRDNVPDLASGESAIPLSAARFPPGALAQHRWPPFPARAAGIDR